MSDDEDDYLYNLTKATENVKPKAATAVVSKHVAMPDSAVVIDNETSDGKNGKEEDSDDDDDSDVEFIIDTKPGHRADPPHRQQGHARLSVPKENRNKESERPANDRPPSRVKSPIPVKSGSPKPLEEAVDSRVPPVDLETPALFDGLPITEIDLETMENKPWRQPGADITDFFNYGFDEFTWTAYCGKQNGLREEYDPQKMMAEMAGMEMMPMDMMMMQSMGMMMPPNMQGMQNMQNMQGMPMDMTYAGNGGMNMNNMPAMGGAQGATRGVPNAPTGPRGGARPRR